MYNPDEECIEMIRKIEFYCKEKGMTHNELAKKAGISKSTLSYLLCGKSKPYVYTILQLCNALEISLHDLVGDETEQEDARLCQRYHGLPEQKKKLFLTYLEMLEQYRKK